MALSINFKNLANFQYEVFSIALTACLQFGTVLRLHVV